MFLTKNYLIILLGAMIAFSSCKKDDDVFDCSVVELNIGDACTTSNGDSGTIAANCSCETNYVPDLYTNSVFVVNEGPFGSFGSIDVISRTTNEIQNAVFQANNTGEVFGDVVQSMIADNGKIYVVVNNSNVIKVINAKTFNLEATIEGFALPRYMVIKNNKGYVSQWGADGETGKVVEVDLLTNSITRDVDTAKGAERLTIFEDKLIVPCSGGFDRASVVQVVDIASMTIDLSIEVGDNPKGAVVDANNHIWVSGSGYTDWNTIPFTKTNGHLVELDPTTGYSIENEIEIENGSSFPRLGENKLNVFYSDGVSIEKVSVEDFSFTTIIEGYYYGFDIDPLSGNIFCADAKDFTSIGEVKVFSPDGVELYSVDAGVIPSHFYFVD